MEDGGGGSMSRCLCSHSKVVSLIVRRADVVQVGIIKEGVRASGLDDARCLAGGQSLAQEPATAVGGRPCVRYRCRALGTTDTQVSRLPSRSSPQSRFQ